MTMQHFLGLLPFIASAAAATNLRRVTDLDVHLRSKYAVEERTSQSSGSLPPKVVVELNNYKGMEYAGPITLGGQSLMAIYDTGSYDLMVVSDHCSTCSVPNKLKVYNSKTSKTFKKGKTKEAFEHFFAGGTIMARLDFDTVQMGSKSATEKVENVAIWQVTDTTLPQWIDPDLCKFTAIVGFGFGETAPDTPTELPPVVQLLERAGTQHFAICLQKGKNRPGYITLNPPFDFASAGFAAMFRSVPVVGNKHWAVEQKGVHYFNGQFEDRRCSDPGECVAIIDSGTSLIGVPGLHMAFISEFAAQIKDDCSNLDKLPDLIFELGGHTFPLPASAYVLQLDGKCYAAFMPLTMASDRGLVWVLGLPFLRHYYTLWDRQGPALYIAEQGEKCEPKLSSNTSVKLAHTPGSLVAHSEPTIGDIREARLPSWMPHGSEKIAI